MPQSHEEEIVSLDNTRSFDKRDEYLPIVSEVQADMPCRAGMSSCRGRILTIATSDILIYKPAR